MRITAFLLLAFFTAVLVAPACIVTDFWLERAHIERDLCVQRMVPEGQRTCHGQCCLMKRLHKTEEQGKDLPAELRSFKLDDMTVERGTVPVNIASEGREVIASLLEVRKEAGHVRVSEPVPWC